MQPASANVLLWFSSFVVGRVMARMHHAPDAVGHNNRVDELRAETTREAVLIGFAESPENQAALIGRFRVALSALFETCCCPNTLSLRHGKTVQHR
ncbi:MAG: DUF4214 domain-containing protein, partial [Rhodoferax sp.]